VSKARKAGTARPLGTCSSNRGRTSKGEERGSSDARTPLLLGSSRRGRGRARQSWPNVARIASVIALACEARAASEGREGDPAVEALAYALAGAIDVLADAVGAAAA
jgi:hypothetical protein